MEKRKVLVRSLVVILLSVILAGALVFHGFTAKDHQSRAAASKKYWYGIKVVFKNNKNDFAYNKGDTIYAFFSFDKKFVYCAEFFKSGKFCNIPNLEKTDLPDFKKGRLKESIGKTKLTKKNILAYLKDRYAPKWKKRYGEYSGVKVKDRKISYMRYTNKEFKKFHKKILTNNLMFNFYYSTGI